MSGPEKVKVKTVYSGDKEIEVSPQEALDLKRQGVLARVADEKAAEKAVVKVTTPNQGGN